MTLSSSVKKHVPIYRLKARYEASSGKIWEDKEIEGRFSQWFDEAGHLQHAELKKWLANNIEVVGMADPQSKVEFEELSPDEALQTPNELDRGPALETPTSGKGTRKARRKA